MLESTIRPISKPAKESTNPSNYRPIALRSVLCKVMEKMVNVRLLDFFNQKGTLSTLKCGGRAKRTTIGHLLSLEATVVTAQATIEQVLSIFTGMDKAYDPTRRHGLLMDIQEAGIEEIMFNFIRILVK